MNYLILIIIFVVITWIVNKRTFYWETVVKFLWKQIYQISNLLVAEIHAGSNEILYTERYKKSLCLRGTIINAILDFVNSEKEGDDVEEETFGYGRFSFDSVLHLAKTNPKAFKKFK